MVNSVGRFRRRKIRHVEVRVRGSVGLGGAARPEGAHSSPVGMRREFPSPVTDSLRRRWEGPAAPQP